MTIIVSDDENVKERENTIWSFSFSIIFISSFLKSSTLHEHEKQEKNIFIKLN